MIEILGVRLHNYSYRKVMNEIKSWLEGKENRFLVTPNPEIVLEAQHNEELFYLLRRADLSMADGFGLKLAGLLVGKKVVRITGADLSLKLLRLANKNKYKVLIVHWKKGLSTKLDIETAINSKFSDLELMTVGVDRDNFDVDYEEINKFAPQIMLVGLGAPWQEKFVYHKRWKIKSLRVSAGIGGAVDFITKKLKRAPKVFRLLGLEWFWRLIQQGHRWRRIYRAVVIFSAWVINWKFIQPFIYRKNVACILYKKEQKRYKLVIIERKGDPGHWQMPQGGTDGEPLGIAARRELTEELNLKFSDVKLEKVYKKVYRYDWHDWGKTIFHRVVKRAGYRGQSQGLAIFKFIGDDKDIKMNYWEHSQWKWVDSDKLVDSVHDLRKEGMTKFLQKFENYLQ